jgi:hypothetical protein
MSPLMKWTSRENLIELGDGNGAFLPAGVGQGCGKLRPAIRGIGALPCLDLEDDLEALGFGKSLLGLDAQSRAACFAVLTRM